MVECVCCVTFAVVVVEFVSLGCYMGDYFGLLFYGDLRLWFNSVAIVYI